ncbi:MAG: amidohydrolase, partial [Flavobacteriaceae bacterium]
MLRKYLIFSMLLCSLMMFSQEHFPKNDGVKTTDNIHMAFTNAKIYVTPTQVIENGTLLLKNGKVVNAASSVSIPADAVTIDLAGKSIYPSFIDVFSAYGVEKPKRAQGGGRSPQYDATRQGFYWNDHIMPENNAIEKFKYDDKAASDLRKAGFGVVNTHIQDGIARGSGALIALNGKGNNSDRIIEDRSAQYFSLRKSVASRQSYPGSVMGSMALLRQVKFDADWYAGGNANVTDRSLEAYIANKNMVNIIHAGDKVNALRVDKVGDEIGTQYVIVGGGDEYEWVKDIKATNAKYIIPINFPKAYDVENPFLASSLELESMREWNQKPFNPKVLADNGVTFALTMHDLKTSKDFKSNLMKAIDHGLDKTKALEALTTVPAQILGKSNAIGSLRAGSWANFLITSGDIFGKETTLYENWVQGKKHVIEDISVKDIRGDYELNLAGKTYDLSITGSPSKPKVEVKTGDQKLGSKLSYKDDWMNLTLTTPDTTKQEFIRLASHIKNVGNMSGKAVLSNGTETSFYAKKTGDAKSSDKKKDEKKDMPKMLPLTYPNGAYGFTSQPRQETILFQNATVWTNENEGVLENTDVLIKNGKISKIGKNLSTSGAKLVDDTGNHVTSGIIDEHSHIAASSINEGGQNSSAEVSIEDVIDAEDVDIYRNLAGGVTSMQILHGSANPIGGRSAIIKLKWGASPQEMIYNNSPKFIKFALGENVKQSNWQSFGRFPQTRMGVEQLYVDYFSRAKEYDALKKSGKPYRKDTELEVLAEILNKERFISCHSYVQSEINMLMKVAEQFNFNINTFTHILEGYKVADKMKEHGVGGSTFSDWWAYKYEVNDAIPHNAAIMHNQGVVTAINSDDGEMSRRLNQEAAKSVKYGGVSEENA